ncbi:DEAD/DEAH box helicase [Methylobacterium sp. Leaf118]|uniref:DEAD/DEAH box helicase n=1 Tax=Methylobacterium sp. Leaf118 TaxID=2876562 RepID=UPI001E3E6865|nr:DEAD/DEAH box helicase [Methylobacterium sp. Leaf118]
MSVNELQTWLLEDGIKDELDLLARALAASEINDIVPSKEISAAAKQIDWPRLLLAAGILARSSKRDNQEAVLTVATSALMLQSKESIKDAGAILLGQIANHRSVSLALYRGYLTRGLQKRLGISARLDAVYRDIDNSVLLSASGEWLQANQFQQRFWDATKGETRWIAVSAPTASGKTYLVVRWLIDQVQANDYKASVYIAPTRALVAELEASLTNQIRQNEYVGLKVSSLPFQMQKKEADTSADKAIYVFTQERLHLFINNNPSFKFDILIVDEAHKVGDLLRGVVLQDAIERTVRHSEELKVIYLSPATQNPGILLEDAPAIESTKIVDSDAPTVLQNVIYAEQVPRDPMHWELFLRQGERQSILGSVTLSSRPVGLRKRLAFISEAVGRYGGTLVYVNGAAEAEAVSLLISQLVPEPDREIDQELKALIDLSRKGVHQKYQLATVVEKGVAFHYGNMPSLLRIEIERLFRSGKIKFLICTSTLIEGVNLSCRTIVMRGPKKGQSHMEPHDFWNLAGRAGRWGDEFQGNIICIDPHDRSAWPKGVPSRARYPIQREADTVISKSDELIEFIDSRMTVSVREIGFKSQLEQVSSYLFSTIMREGSVKNVPLSKRHPPELLDRLDQALNRVAFQIKIPADVAAKHVGVSAAGMQRLLDYFTSRKRPVEELLPAPVESIDAMETLIKIMHRINSHLFPAFYPSSVVPLYAVIVINWMQGYTLARIISSRIAYHVRNKQEFKLPALIRSTMELVEQIARFRAPKYLSAYMDVLIIHLKNIERADLIPKDIDFGIALEFGLSTRTLFSLMELGLSRMSSSALYEIIADADLSPEQCRSWIRSRDLDILDLPLLVVDEIRKKVIDGDSAAYPVSG